jgi:polysaccharide export outer membrane protein
VGPEDVLSIIVWREKDLSTDVTVRPDGRITLPLINDVAAQGLTPDQLRDQLKAQFDKFVEDSSVSVVVKQINSRKVFITGMVGKPGAYPLTSTVTVLQLISMAGGLNEFARAKEIVVMRNENGAAKAIKFNYERVPQGTQAPAEHRAAARRYRVVPSRTA